MLGAAGKRLGYGELVEDAAKLPVPPPDSVPLKSRAAWRYIGKPVPIVDLDDIVQGSAVYGIDVMLPGMLHASVERPPSYGGRVKSYDPAEALKVPGVERVVEIPGAPPPSGFLPLGGVAVIAGNTWAAMQGRQKLQIEWEPGPNAGYDTTNYRAALEDDGTPAGQGGAREWRRGPRIAGCQQSVSAPTTSCRISRTRRWSRNHARRFSLTARARYGPPRRIRSRHAPRLRSFWALRKQR